LKKIARTQFLKARDRGFQVLAIPRDIPIAGVAWRGEDGQRHILISGKTTNRLWLFVLLHEIAHHDLGHCDYWTSKPAWQDEYEADMVALTAIKELTPKNFDTCERASKRHIRKMMQYRITHKMWYNTDPDIARWAGCKGVDKFEAYIRENCR
jgi:hypothetical protein